MRRREFISGGVALPAVFTGDLAHPVQAPPINAPLEIFKNLRINQGPLEGSYRIAPNGMVHWYFANVGLRGVVDNLTTPELNRYILPYLELYLRSRERDQSIMDVDISPNGYTKIEPDSHDSYAATFISLVVAYVNKTKNFQWLQNNRRVLEQIIDRNILQSQKSNGLTSVFQRSAARPSVGYLMDGCEVYRALADYQLILIRINSATDAVKYSQARERIAQGLARLFDMRSHAFVANDTMSSAQKSFYPDLSCQIFPQAAGITPLASKFDAAWAYLHRNAPQWPDGKVDPFPWAIIGYVAALRGERDLAKRQLKTIENTFSTARNLVTINELGYYWRTLKLVPA